MTLSSRNAINLGSGKPRYLLLAEALVRDIQSGRYPIGTLLPTEMMLSEQFGVSRHTAREAVRRLGDLGLISRRRGVGTIVRARTSEPAFTQTISDISDLLQFAIDQPLVLLKLEEVLVDDRQASFLRCRAGRRWLRIEGKRFEGREERRSPLCWTEILLDGAYAGIRDEIEHARGSIYSLVERRYGLRVTEVQQEISADAASRRIARILRVKEGAPVLRITRWYFTADGEMFEVATSVYPTGRFKYSTRVTRRTGA